MWIETSIEVYSAILRHHKKDLKSFDCILGKKETGILKRFHWKFENAEAPLLKYETIKPSLEHPETTKCFIWYHKNEE